MPPLTKNNGRPLLMVLAIFATPLVLAFWLYYGSHWRPVLHTNHGALIAPPVPLPVLPLVEVTPPPVAVPASADERKPAGMSLPMA